jgi:hypothetical protein
LVTLPEVAAGEERTVSLFELDAAVVTRHHWLSEVALCADIAWVAGIVHRVLKLQVQKLGHVHKELLDVLAVQGWALVEVQQVISRLKISSHLVGDLALVFQVRFIAGEVKLHIFWALLHHFVKPGLRALKRLLWVDGVAKNDGVRVPVEYFGDTPKVLFAGRVPNLQLDQLSFHLDRERVEFYANRYLALKEFVLGQTFEHAWFSTCYKQFRQWSKHLVTKF